MGVATPSMTVRRHSEKATVIYACGAPSEVASKQLHLLPRVDCNSKQERAASSEVVCRMRPSCFLTAARFLWLSPPCLLNAANVLFGLCLTVAFVMFKQRFPNLALPPWDGSGPNQGSFVVRTYCAWGLGLGFGVKSFRA